jgi:tRNA U34 5-methylaminomethyl-2-thiouridine-forming methyltransferase MnmC
MNRVEITKDDSPTLYSEAFGQTYHSIHGALSESLHVFIKHGLAEIAQSKKEISIFEMGFGTGLNAALTWQYALQNQLKITYITIEKFPISPEVSAQFITQDLDLNAAITRLQEKSWNEEHIFPQFNFHKIKGDLMNLNLSMHFDLVYFDAFSPSSQPELWTEEIFSKMYHLLYPGGILTTYCAKGQVKRNLKNVGFLVESPPGPMRKREMTVARKLINNI